MEKEKSGEEKKRTKKEKKKKMGERKGKEWSRKVRKEVRGKGGRDGGINRGLEAQDNERAAS